MMKISIKPFNELSIFELYEILHLRSDVFLVEQNCAYDEVDGYDPQTFQLQAIDAQGVLAATLRIHPPGVRFVEASIGRVCVAKRYRGSGLGKRIMQEAIDFAQEQLGCLVIELSAQLYLQNFYESLGFVKTSAPYDDAGIWHIHMRREKDRFYA